MKVVVLGAGASHGASRFSDVPPPLVNEFFSSAWRLGLFDARLHLEWLERFKVMLEETGADFKRLKEFGMDIEKENHLEVIRRFVEEQLGVSEADYLTKPIDIERVIGLTEGALLGRHGILRMKQNVPLESVPEDLLEQQLFLILCGTLVASTRRVTCEYHEALARWLDSGDLVVTFNYDLLMDRALSTRGDWAMNDGYGLRFQKHGRHAGDDAEWRDPLETDSAVKLFKLHGSLNWLYPRDTWETQMHISLRGREGREAPRLVYCLDDMNPDFEEDYPVFEWWGRYEHESDDGYSFDLHSMIVPPDVAKSYRDFEPFVGHLWAETVLSLLFAAHELYFIGYSLREADLRASWLFHKVAAEAEKLRTVRIVDPSDEVVGRISDIFVGVDCVHDAQSIEEFARNL